MNKQKVLILSTAYLPLIGGSELAIKNITDRLSDFKFDLITARLNRQYPKNEKIGNVNVHRVGFGLKSDKLLLPILGFFKARELIDASTILHSYQASFGGGSAWLLKLFNKKIPFIVTLQEGKELDGQNLFIKFFRKLIINRADRATAISRYLKNYILEINKSLKVDIIPNGVDAGDFSKNFSYGELTDLDDKLDIKPDDKVIISVSRLVPKNGLDLLVRAIAVLNKNPQGSYKLVIAGDGPLEESLKFKVKSLKLEKDVIFAGTISHQELPLYLKISDVFVRPSRSEGLGSAFLEAMAAGVPIVGTKVGGIPDFLEDRKTGLFSTHEPEDIAFKIRIILENDKLKDGIIANAAVLVREKYNWDKIAREFNDLYKSLA